MDEFKDSVSQAIDKRKVETIPISPEEIANAPIVFVDEE